MTAGPLLGFDPFNFLTLGTNLANVGPSEAEYRTAIGRLYYAVHLKARESLLATGWKLPQRNQHAGVVNELTRRRHPNVGMVRSLRRLRVQADYKLGKNVSRHDARYAARISARVWERL